MSNTDGSLGRARLSMIGAALLWSTGGAAIKLAAATAPQIAAGRALVAAIALFAFLPEARGRPTRSIFLTSIFYAATCTLYVFANTLTTAANTIFIQNTAPVWVLLFGGWLLGERASIGEKISVPISLAGCLLFFLDDMSSGRLEGNILAAIASLTYAMLIIRYRKTSQAEGLTATVLGNAIICVVLSPLVVSGPTPGLTEISVFVYLGAIQQALAAVLFIRGIRLASALEGALLTLFEPLFSPLWAFIFIGETLGPLAIVGALLVIGSTVLSFAPISSGSVSHMV